MPEERRPSRIRPRIRTAARTVRETRGSLSGALEHPADRIEHRRGRFDQFAERASFLASSPLFFVFCAVLVAAWAVGLALGASDRVEAALAGAMSALTLVLVAVLKNSELRAERALQTKLDAIAGSLLADRRGHAGDAESRLEESIGVHEEI
jgi:Flp pilus assembly protein TadB